MAIKPFAIQGADLTLGGVNLQAGATAIVIPGVTQAVDYFVEEVDERDGNNPSTFGSNAGAITVIDNAEYLYLVDDGDTPSADYVAATYSVDELDDGEIEEINVENQGIFLAADKTRVEAGNMWATTTPTPFATFNSANWTEIPFRPKIRAGTVENVGGGGADTGNFTFNDDTITNDNGLILHTGRGQLAIGTNIEVPGAAQHLHIAFNGSNSVPQANDLFLGDDYNYVKLPGYELNPTNAHGVEIGTNDRDGGNSHNWRFDTDGDLYIPPGKTIRDAMTGDDLLNSSGTSVQSTTWVQDFETSLGAPADVPVMATSVEYLANGDVVALFMHDVNSNSSTYSGVARFDSYGTKVWSMSFSGDLRTDGWGLAVDNNNGFIYVAGSAQAESGYKYATLTKLSEIDGDVVWSKSYDVGYNNSNMVVDVASDGNPVVVGYADNGIDAQIVTTKIDSDTGAVIWSRALDGQGDEQAYGMAVGVNSGEIVSVGYMSQYNQDVSHSVTPLTGSTIDVLIINRSDLNGDTLTNTWLVEGLVPLGTAGINQINAYNSLTGTVRQGSGNPTFDITVSTGSTLLTLSDTDLAANTGGGATVGAGYITTSGFDYINFQNMGWDTTLQSAGTALGPYRSVPVIWGAGSTRSTGFVLVQFYGGGAFGFAPATEGGGAADPGTWYFPMSFVMPEGINVTVDSGGSNYVEGHKIKIPYTAVGGSTTDNDIVLTVSGVDAGAIIAATATQTTKVAGTYLDVSGTNYQTGSGLTFDLEMNSDSTYTEHPYNISAGGTNYVTGDTVTIPGTQLGGTTPEHDLITTVSAVDGVVTGFNTFSGNAQTATYRILVNNSTADFSSGGTGTWSLTNATVDYDDRMLIVKYAGDGTIAWEAAVQVETGFACTGADADIDGSGNIYVCGNFDYYDGINKSAMIIIKFDSAGVKQWTRKVQGECEDFATSIVVGPDNYLYLSAVTGSNNNSDFSMVIAKYNTDGTVVWQRLLDNTTSWTFAGGVFTSDRGGSNLAVRDGYVAISGSFGDPGTPVPHAIIAQFASDGTLFTVGNYDFIPASFSGVLDSAASNITVTGAGKTDSDYIEEFTTSPFSPTFDLTSDLIGTRYSSTTGTVSTVKLTSPGNRKIEEVYGYNSVSVTSRNIGSVVTTTAAFANSGNTWNIPINVSTLELADLLALVNGTVGYYFEVSLDQNVWRRAVYSGYSGGPGPETFTFGLTGGATLFVNGGFTVYYRIVTGGDPVVWWNAADLPNGDNNFRGATIDYHAYTGESTIIGSIHIVNDSGEEHISHSEVQSGSSDGENDDLWLVQNEGTVSYRRIDGESKTLKVQWTAKVFYGSEFYD